MLTGGDVEFEPNTAKIIPLTNSIVAMTAGDSSSQSEIILELQKTLSERLKAEPQNWLVVRDIAYLYAHIRTEIRKKRAEQNILSPLGLDHNSFIARQCEMSQDFIVKISKELLNFPIPDTSTIFAGVDPFGAHIYTVENGAVNCHDSAAFAAIGSGYWHANSQFMLAKHNYESPPPDTVLLTYLAKRRAEVAPGVGNETDMFVIGPNLGSYVRLSEADLNRLESIYRNMILEESQCLERGRKEIQKYVEELQRINAASAKKQEQPATTTDGGGEPPPDRG
jgi:hypothetical protein